MGHSSEGRKPRGRRSLEETPVWGWGCQGGLPGGDAGVGLVERLGGRSSEGMGWRSGSLGCPRRHEPSCGVTGSGQR